MRRSTSLVGPVSLITLYYGLLIVAGGVVVHHFSAYGDLLPFGGIDALLARGADQLKVVSETAPETLPLGADETVRLLLAIVSTVLLMVPVSWVYFITTRDKDVSTSFAQTIMVLPVIVAGIAMIVHGSLALAFSLWRFHVHTGYWGGIAENANMNLTAARCHNIVTQAFKSKPLLLRSKRHGNTRDGRRVSLPGYRVLSKRFADESPLGLRPAMRSPTIRFVGYVGDPKIHRGLRRECYRRTGAIEQLRYSVVNLALQWFIAKQWPTNERGREYFLPVTEVFRYLFQVLVLIPSLIGLVAAIRRAREDPPRALVAVNLLSICVIAAVFFGDPRLRTPYDPYALLLALPVYFAIARWYRARAGRRADAPLRDA